MIANVGNWMQSARYPLTGMTISSMRLVFACVYLKRTVLDAVGPLDERFTAYGGEDDDYSLRIQKAGYSLAVTPEVQVRHGFGKGVGTSSYGREPNQPALAERARDIFQTKWGWRLKT